MGRLIVQALEQAGHEVRTASSFRSWRKEGSEEVQQEVRSQALAEADRVAGEWLRDGYRPDLFLTYHLYHKAPDLIGPEWDEFLESGAASYKALLALYADEITVTDIDQAARMTLYLLNVGMAEYGLYPTQGPAAAIQMSPEQFSNALARAIYGYLTFEEA